LAKGPKDAHRRKPILAVGFGRSVHRSRRLAKDPMKKPILAVGFGRLVHRSRRFGKEQNMRVEAEREVAGIGLTRGEASETRAFDDHGSFSTDLEHLGAPVSSLHVLPCCSRYSRSLEFPLDFQHSTFLLLLQAFESEDLRLVQVLVLVFGFWVFSIASDQKHHSYNT